VRGRCGVAALALVLLTAVSCGGSEGGDGGPLSKAELIQRADEICAESNAENDRLRRRGPTADPTSPNASDATFRRTAATLRAFATNIREEADRLSELEPPASARTGFEGMIARHQTFARRLDAAAVAAEQKRRARLIRELAAAQLASPVRDPFPAQYGFEVCARVPGQGGAA
jgi:hypothetical protein